MLCFEIQMLSLSLRSSRNMPAGRKQTHTTTVIQCGKCYMSEGGGKAVFWRVHIGELLIRSPGSTV